MKRLLFAFMLLWVFIPASLSQLVVEGELRPRFEYRRGYKNILAENQDDALFVSQRTRLGLKYTLPKVSFGISFQDARIWGDEGLVTSTGVFGSESSIDLNEAWFKINLYEYGHLTIGRQYWYYDDERLIARRNWNQSSMKYDGVLFQHHDKNISFDAGLSWNNNIERIFGNEFPSDRMKTLNFMALKKPVNDWFTFSAIAILSGFTQSDTTSALNLMGTYGVYTYFKKDDFKAVLNGYYQNGRSREGISASAYFFSINADYHIDNVTFSVGTDYLSGHDASRLDSAYQAKEHVFDILYGTRHKYFGNLDFFNAPKKSTRSGGLVDIFAKVSWDIHPVLTINMDLHYLSLQNNVIDDNYAGAGTQFLKKGLGPEVDLNFSWDILDFLILQGGYSVMFPSSSMIALQGMGSGSTKNPQWIWVMLTVKPVFYNSENR